jgi:hypothetical protein
VVAALAAFGEPLGQAFQLRDDLRDGEAAHGITEATVRTLVDESLAELDPAVLGASVVEALGVLARSVGS